MDSHSTTSLASSASIPAPGPRHTIDQLALNMGFGGLKPTAVNPNNVPTIHPSKASTSSLASSASTPSTASSPVFQPVITPTSSQQQFEFNDDISLNREISTASSANDLKERTITKVDPLEMTAKPAVVTVPNDPERRAALLLSGPKFQLKSEVIPTDKLKLDNDTIYTVAVKSNISKSNALKTSSFSLDCCWCPFLGHYLMETDLHLFFRFSRWHSLCRRTLLHIRPDVYQ